MYYQSIELLAGWCASSYGLVDNLTYTLNGNQLSTVTDAVSTAAYGTNTAFSGTSSTYAYDANGNLTKDSGKWTYHTIA